MTVFYNVIMGKASKAKHESILDILINVYITARSATEMNKQIRNNFKNQHDFKICFILKLCYRLKMINFSFRENSSITFVQPSCIIMKYGNGRSTTTVRWAELDKGAG